MIPQEFLIIFRDSSSKLFCSKIKLIAKLDFMNNKYNITKLSISITFSTHINKENQ